MRIWPRGVHGRILAASAIALFIAARSALPARPVPEAPATNGPQVVRLVPQADSEVKMWRSMSALLFVVGGLFAATYLLKRKGIVGLGAQDGRRVRLVERYPIDTRRSLLLVALDDHELLLGVGPDRILPLHRQRCRAGAASVPAATKGRATP